MGGIFIFIVLTGVAGFIGSNLAERLLREGHTVIGADNFLTGSTVNIDNLLRSPNFKFIEHDVIYPLAVEGPVDWVMHFASPASPPKYLSYPIETMRVNSEGTMHLLHLAKEKQAAFFLASTSEIYGNPTVHPQPESYYGNVNSIGARSCYNEAKRYAEAITYWMNRKYSIPVRVIRIFNTFGPKMDLYDGRVITNFINQIMSKQNLTIYGDGRQTRSFQYIDDLLEGIMRLLGTTYEQPVNLGNPQEVTILEVAQLLKELMKSNAQIEFLPLPEDDPKRRNPDTTISRKIIDWEPAISLHDALARTIHYYQGQYIH
ncbi:UDP-glucuronate decarboxylase [Paenibacillus sp. FSL R7-269]|uniref:NAD-dependent epimerase/dehydratase family protein n=1 Tax=Paenibacillus sp. FSL R7-269 TaxID=1226755 RepID=UPI0003E2094D|nr:NAD-dependent epimerase/dehydratase family protein [Paenibacillus sp. FSL R7-269]ETT53122.1 UDP-glucuronate decarboxylase [Paenibacillus sp. FSL R7-269]